MLVSESTLIVINIGILEGRFSFWERHCPFVSAVVREAVSGSTTTAAAGEAVKRANTKHMFVGLARYQRRDNDVNRTVSLCADSWEWRTPFRCSLSCLAKLNLPIATLYGERLSAWPCRGLLGSWCVYWWCSRQPYTPRSPNTDESRVIDNMQGRRCTNPVMDSTFLVYSR